jgi:hypothetical protein
MKNIVPLLIVILSLTPLCQGMSPDHVEQKNNEILNKRIATVYEIIRTRSYREGNFSAFFATKPSQNTCNGVKQFALNKHESIKNVKHDEYTKQKRSKTIWRTSAAIPTGILTFVLGTATIDLIKQEDILFLYTGLFSCLSGLGSYYFGSKALKNYRQVSIDEKQFKVMQESAQNAYSALNSHKAEENKS